MNAIINSKFANTIAENFGNEYSPLSLLSSPDLHVLYYALIENLGIRGMDKGVLGRIKAPDQEAPDEHRLDKFFAEFIGHKKSKRQIKVTKIANPLLSDENQLNWNNWRRPESGRRLLPEQAEALICSAAKLDGAPLNLYLYFFFYQCRKGQNIELICLDKYSGTIEELIENVPMSPADVTKNEELINKLEQQYSKTNKKPLYAASAIAVLFAVAFIGFWGWYSYQEKQSRQAIEQTRKAIDNAVHISYAPKEFTNGVILLRAKGVPEKAILSAILLLSSFETSHEMTKAEIQTYFTEQAQAYVQAMNFNNQESISKDARDDIRVANKYLENGDFQAAKLFMKKSIDSKTDEKEDIALRHEYMGSVQALTKDYFAASEEYRNAANILLTSIKYNEKIGNLLHESRRYLRKQAALYGESNLQLEAINALEWQLDSFEDQMSDEEQILFTIELATSYSKLGRSTKNNDYISYAESLLIEFAPACQASDIKPNPQCYFIEAAIADIFTNRGTRTTITQDGAQAHIDRMQKAMASAKSAYYHSKAIDKEEQFASLINELYIANAFFIFISNEEEQENVLLRLTEFYEKSPETFSDIRYAEEILSAYDVLVLQGRRGRYAQESFYLALITARKKLIDQYSFSNNLIWAYHKVDLAEMYFVLYNKTGDLKYLSQLIEHYEPAFQMFIDYAPSELMRHQINFAVKLSNYGYATKATETVLSNAAMSFVA